MQLNILDITGLWKYKVKYQFPVKFFKKEYNLNLDNGVYFIQMQIGSKMYSPKLIISKITTLIIIIFLRFAGFCDDKVFPIGGKLRRAFFRFCFPISFCAGGGVNERFRTHLFVDFVD